MNLIDADPAVIRALARLHNRYKNRLQLCVLTTTMDEFHDEMELLSSSNRLYNRMYLKEVQHFLELCLEAAKQNFNEAYYHRMTKILRIWLKLKLCSHIKDADKLCNYVLDFVHRYLNGSVRKTFTDVLLVIPIMLESRATRFNSKTQSINAIKVIFNRYLGQRQSTPLELSDENFVKRMLCYRAWRKIETDNKRKIEINFLFVGNVRPRSTLISNPKLAPMLPFYCPFESGAYVTLIEANYCTKKLHQVLDAPFMDELLQDFNSPICCIQIDDDDVVANAMKNMPPNMPITSDLCKDSVSRSSPVQIVHPDKKTLIKERKQYMPIETYKHITYDRSRSPYSSKSLVQSLPQKRQQIANLCTSTNNPVNVLAPTSADHLAQLPPQKREKIANSCMSTNIPLNVLAPTSAYQILQAQLPLKKRQQIANSCTSTNIPVLAPTSADQILRTSLNAVRPETASPAIPRRISMRLKCQSKPIQPVKQPVNRWMRGESLRSVNKKNKILYADSDDDSDF